MVDAGNRTWVRLSLLYRAELDRGRRKLNRLSDFLKPAIARQSRVFCWKERTLNEVYKNNMTNTKTKVPARFGPEVRFEVKPRAAVLANAELGHRFALLKDWMLSQSVEQAEDLSVLGLLRRAANEAAALAWTTPYPLLVYPILFEEVASVLKHRLERQEWVTQTTRELLAV
jgi:hypothetical protein